MRPHYVTDYRRYVRNLMTKHDRDTAMSLAVGGQYDEIGKALFSLLRRLGLRDDSYLIDVGCGSGRLASRLASIDQLRYLGTDVVPELLDYASAKCKRPDWRFEVVEGVSIPERNGAVDIVTMFSVLTHLTPSEGFSYVKDAARVLKPGGMIITSFLDSTIEDHRDAAGSGLRQIVSRIFGNGAKNTVLSQGMLTSWASNLALTATFLGPEIIGQSVCVFGIRSPEADTAR